jgi:serine/threonine protein kinase
MDPNKLCVGCMDDDSGEPVCPKCGAPFDLQPKNALQLKPRTVLREQYLIGRALGHGGFGITYLAWDVGLETKLAVKEYMPNGVAGRGSGETKVMAYSDATKQEFEWELDRFMEEARTLKKFSRYPYPQRSAHGRHRRPAYRTHRTPPGTYRRSSRAYRRDRIAV